MDRVGDLGVTLYVEILQYFNCNWINPSIVIMMFLNFKLQIHAVLFLEIKLKITYCFIISHSMTCVEVLPYIPVYVQSVLVCTCDVVLTLLCNYYSGAKWALKVSQTLKIMGQKVADKQIHQPVAVCCLCSVRAVQCVHVLCIMYMHL